MRGRERGQHCQAQLCDLVADRLLAEGQAAQPGAGSRGGLDRWQDQAGLDGHAHQPAPGSERDPGQGMAARSRATAAQGGHGRPEDHRGRRVGQAGSRGAVGPAVQQGTADAPLGEQRAREGDHQRVQRRQQHRDRQVPDRVHVPCQAFPLPGPARQLHGSRATADEHGAQPQVAGPHRLGCQRPGDRGGVGRDHSSHARGEPPGQLPHRPAPQR